MTDGTSNTFIFGEHSKGHLYILDPGYAVSDNSWNSGRWYDTLFATLYPMNFAVGNNIGYRVEPCQLLLPDGRRQLPPRRSELRFCDGSVQFIKNSISSWTFQTGNADSYGDAMPDNTTLRHGQPTARPKSGSYLAQHVAPQLGVYQQLSTRAGGEVISSDSY